MNMRLDCFFPVLQTLTDALVLTCRQFAGSVMLNALQSGRRFPE